MTGKEPNQLAIRRQVNPDLVYLWEWYCDLAAGRGGGFGPEPLRFSEIDAWCRLTGVRLEYWELRVLMAIDGAFLKSVTSK